MRPSWLRGRRPERATAEVDRVALAREVRRIELKARRLVDSHALGGYESIFRGHGIEFSEVRAYQPGDPFQAIDWKVTARMRRPFVKRFVEERELTVLLVVDASGSTGFGTRGRLKRQLAVEVAGLLTLAALRAQDRVGLLLFTDRCEKFVRPIRGRNRTLRLLYDLLGFRPEGRGTDLELALDTASRMLPVRSLVFVISDFAVPGISGGGEPGDDGHAGLVRALTALSRRHEVVAIDVRDPAEEALPEGGMLEVEDPETGERAVVDLSDHGVRRTLARRAAEEDARLEKALQRAGAERLVLRTDRSYAVDLHAFFSARARRRPRASIAARGRRVR